MNVASTNPDVIVVGSGAAALSAAAAAIGRGLRVLVLEKADEIGGTSLKAGAYWIPNNHLMRRANVDDPRDWALRLMARTGFPELYNPELPRFGLLELDYALLEAYYDHGADAVEELEELGAIRSEIIPAMPEYASLLEEQRSDGLSRHLYAEGSPRAALGSGGVLVGLLADYVVRHGGEIRTRHEVTGVVQNVRGEVVGVSVAIDGAEKTFHASRAVIFGTGGFTHDPDMARQFLRGPIFGGCAVKTNTGDFVRIGQRIGAALGNMSNAWWAEDIFEDVLRDPATETCVFMPQGDAMVMVNRFGKRVVNEKAMYNERSQAHFVFDATRQEYPNLLLFMVYDDYVATFPADDPGDTTPRPARVAPPIGGESDAVVTGATIEELAANLDARLKDLSSITGNVRLASDFASELASTIRRFNDYARAGTDPEFGRGNEPIERLWTTPQRSEAGNDTMYPFSPTGPYHALILSPGTLDTKGGPRINPRAQVIDTTGSPIPGLYGAGNCVASPSGQGYVSAGATLGLAVTFGVLAARGAQMEPVKGAD